MERGERGIEQEKSLLMRMKGKKQCETRIQLNVKMPEKNVEKPCSYKLSQSGHWTPPGSAVGFCCCFLFVQLFFSVSSELRADHDEHVISHEILNLSSILYIYI